MSLVTDVFTTTVIEQVVEPTLSPLSDGFTQVNLIHTVTDVITSSILVSPPSPTTSTSRATASTSTSFLSKSKSASATPSASSSVVAAVIPTTTSAISPSSSSADISTSNTALPTGVKAASQESASASASHGSGLPAGAIAGIVIAVVLAMNVIGVLLYRRRALAKRHARRATWRAGVKALALPASLDVEKAAGVPVAPAHTSPFMLGLPGQNTRHSRTRSDGSPESQYSLPSALARSVSRDGVAGRARSASPTRRPSGGRSAPERPPRAATRKSPPTVNQSLPPQSAQNQPGSAGPRTALATPAAAQVPTAVVRVTFIPTRADELSIAIGQTLAVLHAFDDGWALCQNAYGEQGMAPLECLEGGGGLFKGFGGHDARAMMSSKAKRRSSLAPQPQSGRYPRYP